MVKLELKKLLENSQMLELCLISKNGEILEFASRFPIDSGEKNRNSASIMACVALSSRLIKNLGKSGIKHLKINGDNSTVYIYYTSKKNVLFLRLRKEVYSNVEIEKNKIKKNIFKDINTLINLY